MVSQESFLPKPLKNARGYSLVELMVGVAIFTIAMTAILTMVLSSIRGNASSQRMTEGRFLAQGKLEELLNVRPVASLANDGDAPDDGLYQRRWTITAGPTASSRWVAVEVSWDGGDHKVTLRSLARDAGS
ncbi:type IV pilus modification PilV family protein [Trichloromonas sp.]|uniref:type IV pilus modification PilV family protein n=1 Tax=Trichloromonas sp. TaxID=3069249 RepID=UPI003D8156D7